MVVFAEQTGLTCSRFSGLFEFWIFSKFGFVHVFFRFGLVLFDDFFSDKQQIMYIIHADQLSFRWEGCI